MLFVRLWSKLSRRLQAGVRLARLEDDHPFGAARITETAGHGETRRSRETAYGRGLAIADLENRTPTRPQDPPKITQQPANEIEPIWPSIECRARIVTDLE